MQHRIISLPDPGVPGEAPVNTQLSFKPFLDYVRMRLQDRDSIKKEIYKLILEKFAQYPELEAEVKLEDTGKYIELLNLLYMVLSTVVEDEKEVLWGISVPVTPKIFYGSNALYQLLTDAQTHEVKPELIQDDPEMETQKCELLYSFLLEKFYHFNFHKKQEMIRPVLDTTTGLQKFYRINLDTRFVDISTSEDLPKLNLENLQVHLHEENGMDILRRILPLHHFRFSGFSIITIIANDKHNHHHSQQT